MKHYQKLYRFFFVLLFPMVILISCGEGTDTQCKGNIFEGDFVISSQEALNELSGYNEVTGNVSIMGPVDGGMDLSYLQCLTRVGGNLKISHTDQIDISALKNLTSVGGDLVISSNALLTSVDLPALSAVGGSLWIEYNVSLCYDKAFNLRDQVLKRGGIGQAVALGGNRHCDGESIDKNDADLLPLKILPEDSVLIRIGYLEIDNYTLRLNSVVLLPSLDHPWLAEDYEDVDFYEIAYFPQGTSLLEIVVDAVDSGNDSKFIEIDFAAYGSGREKRKNKKGFSFLILGEYVVDNIITLRIYIEQ